LPSPSQEQPEATEEHVLVGGDDDNDNDDNDASIEVRKNVHVPIIDLRAIQHTPKKMRGR